MHAADPQYPVADSDGSGPRRMRCAVALHVEEGVCAAWSDGAVASVGFAPQFPSPHAERVSPGHLLAIVTAPDGREVVVWRWYDAVVLGQDGGTVRLWEPAHGEVSARPRATWPGQEPGSRAYASAGLPGADWWVTGRVTACPQDAQVDLDAVAELYTVNGLWPAVFGSPA